MVIKRIIKVFKIIHEFAIDHAVDSFSYILIFLFAVGYITWKSIFR